MSFIESLRGLFSGTYDNLDFNVHLWFLPCFFVTVIVFNILVNVGGKIIAYIISAFMSVMHVLVPMPELFWRLNRVFKYMGFYAIGVVLAGNIKTSIVVNKKMKAVITLIMLISGNFILSCYGKTTRVMWFITALIGVIAVGISSL